MALIVAVMSFGLIRSAAGDPSLLILGPAPTPEEVASVRAQLGLDRSIVAQFTIWLGGVVQGDLGRSFFLGRDVSTAIIERLPATLQLTGVAFVMAIALGIPAGVVAAVRHNRLVDRAVMLMSLLGVSIPVFWLGLLLIWVFGVQLRWFPIGGYVPLLTDPVDSLRHSVLPAFSLGVLHATLIARITRASMLEVLGQDYIRTARAFGLRERTIIFGRALKNALIPTITVVGTTLGALIGGVVIVETVFTYPGIGRMVVQGVQQRDYNLVQGVLLVTALMYVVVNLLVDLMYAWVDPRIRYD